AGVGTSGRRPRLGAGSHATGSAGVLARLGMCGGRPAAGASVAPHRPPKSGRCEERRRGRGRLRSQCIGCRRSRPATRTGPAPTGGEAGIGKTALAEAIGQDAETRGALVAVGRCFDLTDTPPYGPWRDLFDRFPDLADLPPLPGALAPGGAAETGRLADAV